MAKRGNVVEPNYQFSIRDTQHKALMIPSNMAHTNHKRRGCQVLVRGSRKDAITMMKLSARGRKMRKRRSGLEKDEGHRGRSHFLGPLGASTCVFWPSPAVQ